MIMLDVVEVAIELVGHADIGSVSASQSTESAFPSWGCGAAAVSPPNSMRAKSGKVRVILSTAEYVVIKTDSVVEGEG